MRNTFTKILAGGLSAAVLASAMVMTSCGGGGYITNRLTEPVGDGMLVIGSVIVENVGGRNRREYYTTDIEVSIMGDVEEEGRVVRKNFTIFADKEGYFSIENLPQGRYTLKGVRLYSPGGDWTIWNELKLPNERWMVASAEYRYSFTGEYFNFNPINNVYNFMYNIFSVLPGGEVRFANRPLLREESFYLSDTYTRGFVEQYFIDKFPDSGWTPILQDLLPDIPPK